MPYVRFHSSRVNDQVWTCRVLGQPSGSFREKPADLFPTCLHTAALPATAAGSSRGSRAFGAVTFGKFSHFGGCTGRACAFTVCSVCHLCWDRGGKRELYMKLLLGLTSGDLRSLPFS